jgi:hypothetical protein
VSNGAQPVDLIRRAAPNEQTDRPLVYKQRYYSQASLRILLSDTMADITSLPGIDTSVNPVSLEGVLGGGPASIGNAPVALSAGTGNYKSLLNTSLLGGYIKMERQNSAGVWTDVTGEILALGITGRNISNGTANVAFTPWSPNGTSNTNACLATEPQMNAIIRLQRVKDVPSTHSNLPAGYRWDCASTSAGVMSPNANDYWPLALYDTREGLRRDEAAPASLYYGGVMYYVELDTNNLARWFKGLIPSTTGNQAKNDNGGYVVYFSDRRNNRNSNSTNATPDPRWAADKETGEYGYEDIINPSVENGMTDTGGTPDAGEDLNTDGVLETYGKLPNDGKGTHNNVSSIMLAILANSAPLDINLRPTTAFNDDNTGIHVLRGNRPLLFRRALKLTGGAALRTSAITGLTIVAENPVYVEGNYNSTNPTSTTNPSATETHIAAAIIADSITALSIRWNDITSFNEGKGGSAHAGTPIAADDTGYRFAAVMGKNVSFVQPTGWSPETNFGMDGGAHNLIRQQEYWKDNTFYYRGSIVSFYISRQATGIFKCCSYVYKPPDNRIFNFDSDFLLPDKLPPGTPMFRDVNTLTFRQILRPNQ